MTASQTSLRIESDFPGGNIVVEQIDGTSVSVHQDRRDTARWWFYWACRITGAAGTDLRLCFTDGDVCSHHGPAASWDDGRTWNWLGRDVIVPTDRGIDIRVAVPPGASAVRLALAPPYTEAHLADFLRRNAAIRANTLCSTRKGRRVELLTCGSQKKTPPARLVLTARHHACEMVANLVMEGMLSAIVNPDEDGRWLRENLAVLAVPFMDKDGVEDGDQGKGRAPHDHNRDYDGESCHRETAALRHCLPAWLDGQRTVALDLHCPYVRGDMSRFVYLVGSSNPVNAEKQTQFAGLLETVATGPWRFRAQDVLPFGTSWNTEDNWREGKSCSRWMREQQGVDLATTLEIPYADVYGTDVTWDGARAFGRDLARTLRQWFDT